MVGSGEQAAWREGIGPNTKGLERQIVESDNWDQLQVLEQYPDEVGNRNKGGNLTQREVISTNVIGHTEQFLKTFSKVGFQSSQQGACLIFSSDIAPMSGESSLLHLKRPNSSHPGALLSCLWGFSSPVRRRRAHLVSGEGVSAELSWEPKFSSGHSLTSKKRSQV